VVAGDQGGEASHFLGEVFGFRPVAVNAVLICYSDFQATWAFLGGLGDVFLLFGESLHFYILSES
jgi:hypothetical protein